MRYKMVAFIFVLSSIAVVSSVLAFTSLKRSLELSDELKSKDSQIDTLKDTIKSREELFERIINSNIQLSEGLYKTKSKLDDMKGRSNTVAKKPEMVEGMIDSSFSKFTKELECITGYQSSCQ